jgi:DNA-binding transcriptional MerR regulator
MKMEMTMTLYKDNLSIDNVFNLTGIPKSTLRFWEKVFCDYLSPKRTKGRQRRYSRDDLQRIMTIKQLLTQEGYTIAGARKRLAA